MASRIPYSLPSGDIVYPAGWRLVPDRKQGEIHGLPTLRGAIIATDGVLIAIQTWDGKLLIGHLDFFVPDKNEPTQREAKKVKASRKPKVEIEDFC